MMTFLKCYLFWIYFCSIVISFQVNLDLTEWESDGINDSVLQHDCLDIFTSITADKYPRQTISYCMSVWPSKWNIEMNNLDNKYTFADLSTNNITSYQLYLWSAPLEIVENYQFYLNQHLISNETSLSEQIYYNCTFPQFGSFCQYSLIDEKSDHLSMSDFIRDYYSEDRFRPVVLTCYINLECNLGSSLLCLDWSDICDNYIQCIDGADEEHCWQLETNECEENEYRCRNGQCIPLTFFKDDVVAPECLDGSDISVITRYHPILPLREPTMTNEDIICWLIEYHSPTSLQVCTHHRLEHLIRLMSFATVNSTSDTCLLALRYYLRLEYMYNPPDTTIYPNETCQKIINDNCPEMFYMPDVPIAAGHIYLAFTKQYIVTQKKWTNKPEYICYNDKLCGTFNSNIKPISFNNSICHRLDNLPNTNFSQESFNTIATYLPYAYTHLAKCHTIIRNDPRFCDNPNMYQCVNSTKCIARVRLFDKFVDCDYADDELSEWQILNNANQSIERSETHFRCPESSKWISRKRWENNECDCQRNEDGDCFDEHSALGYYRSHISFATICDGIIDLTPLIIDGRNETECEQWSCNNTYTRCNGYWNCFNGADEMDCYPSSLISCPPNSYVCISSNTTNLICLPMNKGNDGQIDCLGATDEPQLCQNNSQYKYKQTRFYCKTENNQNCLQYLPSCPSYGVCENGEDHQFCNITGTDGLISSPESCGSDYEPILSESNEYLCNLFQFTPNPEIVHFSFGRARSSNKHITQRNINTELSRSSTIRNDSPHDQDCHRGLSLRVWLNKNEKLSDMTCLCPPSYYGDMCQYQNERVSLTLKVQTFSSSWRTPFTIIVSLIDNSDERIIHSYEQFTYLSMQTCETKYNIYLLYSNRPINLTKEYSIHIDIYEKFSLSYRGSLFVSIPFLFLPIQRIALLLNIPDKNSHFKSCSDDQCIHGHCVRYFNDRNERRFCQCHKGWSGRYCTIPYNCMCSSDSICLGILSNNRSICVCPINKWGSRCLLDDQICQLNKTCQNNGQCIPINQYIQSDKKFECICSKDFFGDQCEIPLNKVILSFNKDLILPETMLIHFIERKENDSPEKGMTFKKIPIDRNPISIYWSRPFHIAFVELFINNYYLILVQQQFNQSITFEKRIQSSDRCPNIVEIFNETFAKLHLIRRIKYFHFPCQNSPPSLSCFYDKDYFCLCIQFGSKRLANCFPFNHRLKLDCFGKSLCENGGECLQDSINCPQTSICVCPKCFYGSQCQFTSNGYVLSLDAILGYHIQPYIDIVHQPVIVQISLTLTVVITLIGLVNGIFSLITFQNKVLWTNACGIYLLGSSITTLLTIILFFVKFLILFISQMTFLTNRSFLQFQCVTIDYLLKIALNMDQWLNACVALERSLTIIKGIHFNTKKNVKMGKYLIFVLLIFVIITNIFDPIHRRLIDEDNNDEKRIWCIVTYSPTIEILNKTINLFHFCVPFLINFISTIIIIRTTTILQLSLQTSRTSKHILIEQFQQHKHLFISSFLLVILSLPRLVITFAAGCIKRSSDSWLFLLAYFISFIPPMLTFIIFVAPSNLYKQQFRRTINQYQQTIKRRWRPTS